MSLGREGETLARRYLEARGLLFRGANVRVPGGEIDLVMEDPARGERVFVEVRTRADTAFGRPEESLSPKKRHILARSIQFAVQRERWTGPYRCDVVSILLPPAGQPEVTHLTHVALAP